VTPAPRLVFFVALLRHAKEQITKLKLKGDKLSRVGKNWRQKERERRAFIEP